MSKRNALNRLIGKETYIIFYFLIIELRIFYSVLRRCEMFRIFLLTILCPVLLFPQEIATKSPWQPLQFFVGRWEGTGDGKFGFSKIEREYQFINGWYVPVWKEQVSV